jgi:hypothetical protein
MSATQPDLFGDPAPAAPAYVVPYPIAVNTLRRTLEMLQAAEVWPWDADMKAARMERNVPKMLAVLPRTRLRTGAAGSRPRPRGSTADRPQPSRPCGAMARPSVSH